MKTEYLKYDAQSIVEYLRKKLIDSGVYTDQVYPASDIKLLLDIFGWTFEVLQYILNNNAADVMFTDSELYENMNRLTKLLSYSPKAYRTSTCEFSINARFDTSLTTTCVIPKYAKIETDKSDANGDPITYSFTEDFQFNVKNGNIIYTSDNIVLSNGRWCLYTFDNLSLGGKYEVFRMTSISPDNNILVDNDNFDVFIETVSSSGERQYEQVKIVDSLILNASPDDLYCEKRLNDKKEFEIKFGDGIHGKILPRGAKIHIIYLKSNGINGKILGNTVSTNMLSLKIDGISSTNELVNMLFGGTESFKIKYGTLFMNSMIPLTECRNLYFTNITESSNVLDYEGIDEIREFAPKSFRMGQRLVTRDDFRTYILSEFSNRVSDVYVCNNNEYLMNFYRWLDLYGCLNANARLNDFEYMDAVDFNNIYIWVKPNNKSLTLNGSDKKAIIKKCNNIKTITSNIVPCEAVKKFFIPYVGDKKYSVSRLLNIENDTKIVITKNQTFLSDSTIKKNVVEVIIRYFKEHEKLGEMINISNMVKDIKALGYVNNISTRRTENNVTYEVTGLSFMTFTESYINYADADTITEYCNLQNFQYAYFPYSESVLLGMIQIDNSSFALKNDEI